MTSIDIGFSAPNWTSRVRKMDSASKTTSGTEFVSYLEKVEFFDHVNFRTQFRVVSEVGEQNEGYHRIRRDLID